MLCEHFLPLGVGELTCPPSMLGAILDLPICNDLGSHHDLWSMSFSPLYGQASETLAGGDVCEGMQERN